MKNEKLKDLYELADEADMLENPEVEKWLEVLSVDPEPDEDLLNYLENILTEAVHSKRMAEPFPEEPNVDGKYRFGRTTYGCPAGFNKDEILRHALIVGDTGSGKTTLYKNILAALRREGINFWVVDVKGKEYRETCIRNNDLVLPSHKIKINPLQSPSWIRKEEWIKQFVDAFGEVTGLLSASKNHLKSQIYELMKLHPEPSFLDLLEFMTNNRPPRYSTEENYHTRIINRNRPLVEDEENSVFTYSKGIPMDDLVNQNVVFEVDGFQIDERKIVLSYLLKYLFLYRKHHKNDGELQNVVMMDESRYLFNRKNDENYNQESYTFDEILDRIRGFGAGLIISEHIPSKLSQAARANTGSKIMLHLSDAKDIGLMSDTIALSEEQEEKAVDLEVGKAILKKRNKDPVEVNVSYARPDRDISEKELEEELSEKYQKIEQEVKPRYTTEKFDKAVGKKEEKEDEEKEKEEEEGGISEEAESLLKDINFNPLSNLTDRYDRLELSRNKGTKAVGELEDGGFVKSVQINVGRGGRPKFFELTDKGKKYLQETDVKPTPTRGRGGIKHTYWQKKAQEFLREKGFDTFLEYQNADVYGEKDGRKIGVEIVTRKDYTLSNVVKYIKNLETDKFIVAADKKLHHVLKAQADNMDQKFRKTIRFCRLQELNKSDSDLLSDSSSS